MGTCVEIEFQSHVIEHAPPSSRSMAYTTVEDFHTYLHTHVLELVRALGEDRVDALLADGQRLADAEDAGQALVQDVLELRGHELRSTHFVRGQPEFAAPLRVADEDGRHAHEMIWSTDDLARVRAAAREVAVLGRDFDARLERVLDERDVQIRRADADVALVEVLGAAVEVRDELVERRGRGGVALPVAAHNRLAGHAARGLAH